MARKNHRKRITAEIWLIFAGHNKPPKIGFIFGGQIPPKIGHYHQVSYFWQVGIIFGSPEPPKNAIFPVVTLAGHYMSF
jgi:hypothetical protein